MNVMMASGGYPWTIIPVENRTADMHALEKASVGEDIAPFADFVTGLVEKLLVGEPLPRLFRRAPKRWNVRGFSRQSIPV